MNISRIKRRGLKSPCRYKVVAVGIHKGEVISIKNNLPRDSKNKKNYHAEEVLLRETRNLDCIYIARVGNAGDFLPIRPCKKCIKLASKYGITIRTLKQCQN